MLSMKPPSADTCDVHMDFEPACIREFSHPGLHLGIGVSREERRQRIHAAIPRESKAHPRRRNSEFTYADMYARAYRQSVGANGTDDEDPEPMESRCHRSAVDDEFADDEEAFGGTVEFPRVAGDLDKDSIQ
jgi:hypothetical protein